MTRTMSPLKLGYSILAGPVIWFAHFVMVYALAEFGCRANFTNVFFFTPDGIRTAVVVITVIALIGVGAGGLLAYRGWQSEGLNERGDSASEPREHLLMRAAMLLSGLFLFSIVMTTVPVFIVSVCDPAV